MVKPTAETGVTLTETEKKDLITIARTTLENHIRGKAVPQFTPATDRLKELCGAFVTLKKHGQLRGCIGYVQGIKPLYQTVSEMAIAASTQDPRFRPVQPQELKDIKIEITALTPLERISDPNTIEVGKHGILIKQGWYQGLLLPQVATEEGWDRETFLANTCLKAGLPPDAWKAPNTEIYVFSGQVFDEQ